MTDTDRNGLGGRLRRLPGQLLLALVNGTAVLVILAAVLALVAIARIDGLSDRITATVTDAVMAETGVDPRAALADLQGLRADIRGLSETLTESKVSGGALVAAIERLEGRLDSLEAGLAAIRQSRTALIDEGLASVSRSFADALARFQGCAVPPAAS
jgi:hypothetical protein